jgi:hypothetical protein
MIRVLLEYIDNKLKHTENPVAKKYITQSKMSEIIQKMSKNYYPIQDDIWNIQKMSKNYYTIQDDIWNIQKMSKKYYTIQDDIWNYTKDVKKLLHDPRWSEIYKRCQKILHDLSSWIV